MISGGQHCNTQWWCFLFWSYMNSNLSYKCGFNSGFLLFASQFLLFISPTKCNKLFCIWLRALWTHVAIFAFTILSKIHGLGLFNTEGSILHEITSNIFWEKHFQIIVCYWLGFFVPGDRDKKKGAGWAGSNCQRLWYLYRKFFLATLFDGKVKKRVSRVSIMNYKNC